MRAKKIKIANLPSVVEGAGMNGFEYPTDYKMDYAMFHHCKYCKGITLSRNMSLFGDSLVYSCINCGGREKCTPEAIIKQKKNVGIIAIVVLVIVFFGSIIISANASEVKEEYPENGNSYAVEAEDFNQVEYDYFAEG